MKSMAKLYPARYVAEGYYEDAKQLLKQFAALKSLKFSDFANIWKDLRFPSIFRGREVMRELTEFIDECYRNTFKFMDDSDPFMKVGVVYLLYSLYQKQPFHLVARPVQIPVSVRQLQEIYQLENHFKRENSTDAMLFSYIIEKLFKMEAVRISCFPIPMGLAVPTTLFRKAPLRNSCFKEILGAFRMFNEKELKNIRETAREIERLKKTLPYIACINRDEDINALDGLEEYIARLEKCYDAGLTPSQMERSINQEVESMNLEQRSVLSMDCQSEKSAEVRPSDLGERRALLKAQQFGRAAETGLFSKTCQSDDFSPKESSSTLVEGEYGEPETERISDARRKKSKRPSRRHYFEDEDY